MTFCVENETEKELPFDVEEVAGKVMEAALEQEGCPYEASIELLLTDNEGIHAMNREFRNIDRPTDVLSFPNVDYEAPADFEGIEDSVEDYFDPETGELCLGDIVISIAFLVAHSMLHLLGYDHMEPDEAEVMEAKQEEILTKLGITR